MRSLAARFSWVGASALFGGLLACSMATMGADWTTEPSADLQRERAPLHIAYGTYSYQTHTMLPSFAVWGDGLVMSCWAAVDGQPPRLAQCRHALVGKGRRDELLRSVKACGMLDRPEVDESGGSSRVDGQIVHTASSEPRIGELVAFAGHKKSASAKHRSEHGTGEEHCLWAVFAEAAGAATDCSIFPSEKRACCEDAESVGRSGQSCKAPR